MAVEVEFGQIQQENPVKMVDLVVEEDFLKHQDQHLEDLEILHQHHHHKEILVVVVVQVLLVAVVVRELLEEMLLVELEDLVEMEQQFLFLDK